MPPEEQKREVEPRQDPYWKEPTFQAALWIGGGLVVTGLGCFSALPVSQTVAVLVLCSGLGILFGAFGSTAVVRYKGVVVAGVAATAVVLVLLVNYLTRDDIVRLRIAGDVKGSLLGLYGDEAYPGADHNQFYEFVVIGRELKISHLSLMVTASPSNERPNERREVLFECIPQRAIGPYLGSGKTLQWRFDAKKEQLSGVDGKIVASGPCPDGEKTTVAEEAPAFANTTFSLISSAYAQTPARAATVRPYIRDLYSDSATVRRDARQTISKSGVDAIPELMGEWERNPTNYRVRLGASVSLAEFLRSNKGQRTVVSSKLTDRHLELLTQAAGDPDRTIRIYASEFLYTLGDRRALPAVQRVFPQTTEDGKYNLVVVLKGVSPVLSTTERSSMNESLRSWRPTVGQTTRTQIDGLLAMQTVTR